MSDRPAEIPHATATLKAGSLHWLEVAALGIAIAISGNVSGWNYGLGVGGWGGMLLASLAMAVLFLCLTQSLAELAAALPNAGGFDVFLARFDSAGALQWVKQFGSAADDFVCPISIWAAAASSWAAAASSCPAAARIRAAREPVRTLQLTLPATAYCSLAHSSPSGSLLVCIAATKLNVA